MELKIVLKNTNEADIENILITIPVLDGLYPSYMESDGAEIEYDNNNLIINKEVLAMGEETTITISYNTSKLTKDMETIKMTGTLVADNLDEISLETSEKSIQEKNFLISEYGIYDQKVEGNVDNCVFGLTNYSQETMTNLVITKVFSDKVNVENIYVGYCDNAQTSYDQSTGTLKVNIPTLEVGEYIYISYDVSLDSTNLTGNEYIIDSKTSITTDNSSQNIEYMNQVEFDLLDIEIILLNEESTEYVSAGQEIIYTYEIKNNSKFDLSGMKLMLDTSDNLEVNSLEIEDVTGKYKTSNVDNIDDGALVFAKEDGVIKVVATGTALESATNTSAVLFAKIAGETIASDKNYSIIEEVSDDASYEVTGVTFIDSNSNGKYDNDEEVLSGLIVELYDSETNEKIETTITDISGRYIFNNLNNGKYYVKFNYDDTEYVLSEEISDNISENKSDVLNINDNYMTDNVIVENQSVGNIDLALSNDNIFDLKLEATAEKITVQNSAESNEFNREGTIAKVDIDPELVAGSRVSIEYKIIVKNQGSVSGTVNKIVDYLDEDMEFDSSLNPDWYLDTDGNLCTRALNQTEINPGEEQELTLILVKNMTEENTGLIHNCIEISDAINEKGIADIDSTPGNKLDEDDLAYADSIIGVSTGFSIGILPTVLSGIVIVILLVFLGWRIIEKRRYI